MSPIVNSLSILDVNKLTGTNFIDWLRNLRIVLNVERIVYVLDGPLPESPAIDASIEDQNAYQKHLDDIVIATCIMLAYMSLEL